MALRRGFKAEAERLAQQLTAQLRLADSDPVDPWRIAEHLGVEVVAADELVPREQIEHLRQLQPDAFSACTFKLSSTRTVVVYNPLHDGPRTKSDITHELAHLLLGHELTRVERIGGVSFLTCDVVQEEEATWLGGCLLLPRSVLLRDVSAGRGVKEIAKVHGVSEQMAQYRFNVTGVARQTGRARR